MMDKRNLALSVNWNVIAITFSDSDWRDPIEKECLKLKAANQMPQHDLLLLVDDPQFKSISSVGVGSGGATLNALLVTAERLSALEGHTVVNTDLLHSKSILMVHFGRNSPHLCGGNALMPVNSADSWIPPSLQNSFPTTILVNSLWMTSVLASNANNGVWITSMDFYVPFNNGVEIPTSNNFSGALICSFPVSGHKKLNVEHGILKMEENGKIQTIAFEKLPSSKSKVSNIVSGSLFLSSSVAEKLVSLHTSSPIDRCTYYGTDSDTEPVQLSLYFDLLLPLCSTINKEKYLSGELSLNYSTKCSYNQLCNQESAIARKLIWTKMNQFQSFSHNLNIEDFDYLDPNNSFDMSLNRLIESLAPKEDTTCCKNPLIAYNSIVESIKPNHHLFLNSIEEGPDNILTTEGGVIVANCELKCISLLGRNLVWQEWILKDGETSLSIHGRSDFLSLHYEHPEATIFNISWRQFFNWSKLTPEDIWDASSTRNLLNAKLFLNSGYDEYVMEFLECLSQLHEERYRSMFHGYWELLKDDETRQSLSYFMKNYDLAAYLERKTSLTLRLIKRHVKTTAQEMTGTSLLPFFKYTSATSHKASLSLLSVLHDAVESASANASRLFANIADLLGCMAMDQGGLRSGPASNKHWVGALQKLQEGELVEGIRMMREVCFSFIESRRPENLIRAARHYERASHIMISKQVETSNCRVFPYFQVDCSCLPPNVWVEASAPARVDLAGGWTDTPPICYEQGGAVLNIALKIEGQKPIGAKARIIPELQVICVLKDRSGFERTLFWTHLDELKDYNNPITPGALIKASLVYTNFVDLYSQDSLVVQLEKRYKGGLEIVVWSDLANGSGLGGSSIIAGTVLGTIFVLMGHSETSVSQLIHATLGIEQMMTTGGGWQDQVGGLVGGMKLGTSSGEIPLTVDHFCLPLNPDFMKCFEQRTILIYTGKIRLARNLLQTVLRNWYAREDDVMKCFRDLRLLAVEATEAALTSNVDLLGSCFSRYWQIKKTIAPGSEPAQVTKLLSVLSDDLAGAFLTGAGGGGYMFALLRHPLTPQFKTQLQNLLKEDFEDMYLEDMSMDNEGLVVSVGGKIVVSGAHDKQAKINLEMLTEFKDF